MILIPGSIDIDRNSHALQQPLILRRREVDELTHGIDHGGAVVSAEETFLQLLARTRHLILQQPGQQVEAAIEERADASSGGNTLPVPVMVNRGRILGKQQTPITEYIMKPFTRETLLEKLAGEGKSLAEWAREN